MFPLQNLNLLYLVLSKLNICYVVSQNGLFDLVGSVPLLGKTGPSDLLLEDLFRKLLIKVAEIHSYSFVLLVEPPDFSIFILLSLAHAGLNG